ncbi:hypothetical protein FBU59_005108 [Linderina macrospora]|uniref:Uncharacterized protein n=1 Tax=Linderina macrospora TaxID=4868 RepID=A0ACC1J3M3_9FUNG|nr:hypothetical protein FBU59_005108 [Linderina macrospora]
MAREGFERQKSALQCAKWVDSSMEEQPESVIVLSSQSASSSDAGQQPSDDQPELLAAHGAGLPRSSSSMVSSSSLDSLSSLIPRQPTEPIRRAESEPPAEATSGVAQPRQQQPAQSNVVTHGRSEQGPNYAQMDIETLQDIARMYGLRTNTPKRLLVHQLTQIWEQMHTGQLSSSNEGPPRVQTNIEPLYRDLRAYIRSNTGILDDVLCYKVLDFERVYQAINASVQCDRWMLRKFFDSEGIVYTAAFDRSKHRGHA